jgi:hypothetical protein
MSNPTHILDDEEQAEFNTEDGRGKVRAAIASRYLSNETITILNDRLEPIDLVVGMIPAGDEIELAVPLTEEEREQLAADRAKLDEEVKRLEEVVRPECMRRLKAEVQAKYRQERRELANEVLELRAKVARFEQAEKREDNHWKGKYLLVQAELARLKGRQSSAAATDAPASAVEESFS